MNLILDFGNTNVKMALFEQNELIKVLIVPNSRWFKVSSILQFIKGELIEGIIVSSVTAYHSDFSDFFKTHFHYFIELNHTTKLPIQNKYSSPETLGYDRIAAAVGANTIFPNTNVLCVDSGTAITFDFINDNNEYLGGNISLGIDLRFKALNTFTKKLPLVKKEIDWNENQLFGNSTSEAILLGVQNAILYEIESYIEKCKLLYADSKVILTGGDTFFFAKRLKNSTFAEPNLVLIGLNKILEYNKL